MVVYVWEGGWQRGIGREYGPKAEAIKGKSSQYHQRDQQGRVWVSKAPYSPGPISPDQCKFSVSTKEEIPGITAAVQKFQINTEPIIISANISARINNCQYHTSIWMDLNGVNRPVSMGHQLHKPTSISFQKSHYIMTLYFMQLKNLKPTSFTSKQGFAILKIVLLLDCPESLSLVLWLHMWQSFFLLTHSSK